MAEKKPNPKKSMFNAPTYGIVEKIPEGYVAKKDKDGVVHYVPAPKKKEKK